MDWVRLYHDMPIDPKWRVIAKRSGQRMGDVIAVFNFVLCNASSNPVKRGVTHGFVTEDVAAALDLTDENVSAILAAMEGKVLKKGALLGWDKRNPLREDSSTERVKRWRETQRNAEKRPELESEVETEKKKEEQEPLTSFAVRSTPELVVHSPPVEPASTPPSKPKRQNRTTLPEAFPNDDDMADALAFWRTKGRTDLRCVDEMAKFRAHHTAHGKTMADWPAAWRTWFHNALDFNRQTKVSSHDKGSEGAALYLASLETRDRAGPGDRAGTAGDPLPANGHGFPQVGGPVRDIRGGLSGQEPGGDPRGLPAVSAKR